MSARSSSTSSGIGLSSVCDLDEESGRVLFNYQLIWDSSTDRREKKLTFTEVFFFGEGHDWDLVSHGLLALLAKRETKALAKSLL